MKITFNKQELEFRYNWGSLYTYEKITDEPLNVDKNMSRHVLLYSILLFNNQGVFSLTWNEFIAIIEDYSELKVLTDALVKELELKAQEREKAEQGEKEKTKKKD